MKQTNYQQTISHQISTKDTQLTCVVGLSINLFEHNYTTLDYRTLHCTLYNVQCTLARSVQTDIDSRALNYNQELIIT